MIRITSHIQIDEGEIALEFVRAPGPGGQNVNKVATAVQLRFPARHSASLPQDVRERLEHLAGRRMTRDGWLVIVARRHRTQERNRQDAIDRLIELIRRAATPPKTRRATKPTTVSQQERLERKRRRGEAKRQRGRPPREED